jgi:mannonate dehydratase
MPDGSFALFFHYPTFAAFDIHVLKRKNASKDYDEVVVEEANRLAHSWEGYEKAKVANTVLRGLPGAEEHFTLGNFQDVLDGYKDVNAEKLRANLYRFVGEVAPLAERLGINLSIHPDDPPFPLLGLPRVMSTEQDAVSLLETIDVQANGLCFCTGSFGARPDNDLPQMVHNLASRIHFIHLRAVKRDPQQPKTFVEANHLEGDADMVSIIEQFVVEEERRRKTSRPDHQIPMRPDHGHQMLDDLQKSTNPGYSAIGRLRGLAELRGIESALKQKMS